jgi:hypothetical protein
MKTSKNILTNISKSNMQQLTSIVTETVATINNKSSQNLSSHVMQTILRGRFSRSTRTVFDFSGNVC